MDKEVRELVAVIEADPRGFKVRQDGKHLKVFLGDQAILDPQGGHPVTLPTTPSTDTWYENTMKMLVRSRVLADDPKKVGQRGLSPEQEAERGEERERRDENREQRETFAERARQQAMENQANTTVLRNRYDRLFSPIGVWKAGRKGTGGSRGSYSEIASVAYHWAEANDVTPRPPSVEAAKQSMRTFFQGASLSDDNRSFYAAFADHLERTENPTRAYNALLRKLLGIGETRAPAPPEPSTTPEPEEEQHEDLEEGGPVGVTARPSDVSEPQRGPARAAVNGELTHLRELLEQAEREREQAERERVQAVAENDRLKGELDAAKRPRFTNGDVPTVALETVAEMIGQHITVGPEDATSYEEIQKVVAEKRRRALEIGEKILEMELRAT